jgi:hypothetical protein
MNKTHKPAIKRNTPVTLTTLAKAAEAAEKADISPKFPIGELRKIFGADAIEKILELILEDRLAGNFEKLTNFIKTFLPKPYYNYKGYYVIMMLDSIVNNVKTVDRVGFIKNYMKRYGDDKFQVAFAMMNIPHLVLAHILINNNEWKSGDISKEEFYHINILGLLFGTISYFKGAIITKKEYDAFCIFGFGGKINKIDDNKYEVLNYICSPKINSHLGQSGYERIQQLFIVDFHELIRGKLFSMFMHTRDEKKRDELYKNTIAIFNEYLNAEFELKNNVYFTMTVLCLMVGVYRDFPDEFKITTTVRMF